jgi:hypothetical protein
MLGQKYCVSLLLLGSLEKEIVFCPWHVPNDNHYEFDMFYFSGKQQAVKNSGESCVKSLKDENS